MQDVGRGRRMEKPNFYGIMPADVRYDKNLKPMEKILYTEITALSNKEGYCFATNSYFGELYEVNKKTVSGWISNLEKQGYIKIVLIYKKGTKEIVERRIYINQKVTPINENTDTYVKKDVVVSTKYSIGYPQKNGDPIHKKVEDNNTRLILQDDDVNKDIDITQKENNTTKFESNNEHQTFVVDLAKTEMLKLCKNQMTVDTALITHRYKIQSLYKFLGKNKFLETFEKIQESTYLLEQSRNAGQFFNWLFSSKKENFLSVFNDVYIDKNRSIAENETIPAYPELSEKDFDMDSMWED